MNLIERIAARIAKWRTEAAELHARGADDEAAVLEACANDLQADMET